MASGNELTARLRAPFTKFIGNTIRRFQNLSCDNDWMYRASNALRTDVIDLIGTDALNNRIVGGQIWSPMTTPVKFEVQANSKIGQTSPFFVNCNDTTPLEVVGIRCNFNTADGATNTGYVVKDAVGTAAGSGATCMSGTFNLNATANTVQTATLAGVRGWPTLVLGPGEQLTFKIASAVTSLAGLLVEVLVRPVTGTRIAQYYRPANGDIATYTMDLNIIPGSVIRAVAMRWSAAGTNGSAVTADITKDTSTTAPGAGTSILLAAQSVKGTANVSVYPTLAASSATLTMASGDRLALVMTGTLTALAGLVVTVFYNAGPDQHIVVPFSLWDSQAVSRNIYIAPGMYVVEDFWMTWSTASTSNTQLLEKDTGTTAPGSGTGLVTDNSNAGILTSATANTPIGSLTLSAVSTKPSLWMAAGDRLGLKDAGTTGSLAGGFGTVLLRRP